MFYCIGSKGGVTKIETNLLLFTIGSIGVELLGENHHKINLIVGV